MNPDKKTIKKILIIRFRRVGDAVISSVLCSSLRKSFPDVEIHYILNENIAPLFENHPDIDKLITFSDSDQASFFRYIKKVVRIVRSGKYDLIIDTRSTIKTLWFSLFSMGTSYRIGRRKSYNALLQNYRIPVINIDEVSETLRLLDPLRQDFPIRDVREFRLYPTEEEKAAFKEKMLSSGIDMKKPVIVCAVTARLKYKIWDMKKTEAVICRIIKEYPDAQLIFNYAGEREKEDATEIYHAANDNPHIFIDLEATNLRELLAMFSFSSFFFGNEGGPRHISQAMNVPSFAIFPPRSPKGKWLPNASERFQGIELADIDKEAASDENLSFVEKLELIDVESVWNRLDCMLKEYLKIDS